MNARDGREYDGAKPTIDFMLSSRGFWTCTDGLLHEDEFGYLKDLPDGVTATRVLIDSAGGGGVSLYHRTGTFYIRYPASWRSGSTVINAYTPGNTPAALGATIDVAGLYAFVTTHTQQAVTIQVVNHSGAPKSLPKEDFSVHRAEHDERVWDTPGSASGTWLPEGVREIFNPDYLLTLAGCSYTRTMDTANTNGLLGFGNYGDGHDSPPPELRMVASTRPLGRDTDVAPFGHISPFGGQVNVLTDGTEVPGNGYGHMGSPRMCAMLAKAAGTGWWLNIPESAVTINDDYTVAGKIMDEGVIGIADTNMPVIIEMGNELPWNIGQPYVRSWVHLKAWGEAKATAGHPLTCIKEGTYESITWAAANDNEKVHACIAERILRIRDMALARFNPSQVKFTLNGHVVLPYTTGALFGRYVETQGVNAGKRVCQIIDYACIAPYNSRIFTGPRNLALPAEEYDPDPETSEDDHWRAQFMDGWDVIQAQVDSWVTMLNEMNAEFDGIMELTGYEAGCSIENRFQYHWGPDCTIDSVNNVMVSTELWNGISVTLRSRYLDGDQWNNYNGITDRNDLDPVHNDGTIGGAYIMKFVTDTTASLHNGSPPTDLNRVTIAGNPGTYPNCNGTRWQQTSEIIWAKQEREVQREIVAYSYLGMRGKMAHVPQYTNLGQRTATTNWGAMGTQDNGLNPAMELLTSLTLKGVATGQP